MQDKNNELTMRNYFKKYWAVPATASAFLLVPLGWGVFALLDGDLSTGLTLVAVASLCAITVWLLPCYLDLRKAREQDLTLEDLRFPRRRTDDGTY